MQHALWLLLGALALTSLAQEDGERIDGDIIGIDLGHTHSCVGIYKNGRVKIIPNDRGNRTTPSYVAFTDELLVGEAARDQAIVNPSQTLFDVKRFIGSNRTGLKTELKRLPFTVIEKGGKYMISVKVNGEEKVLAPEEVSAMVLAKMKETAENYLGREVKHAVIAVPAYFDDAQRQAMKDAGALAGLNVLRIIDEPTAAAIAHDLYYGREKNVLIYHLGGSTFTASLLYTDREYEVVHDYEVLDVGGDAHLGGEAFDERTTRYFIKVFEEKNGRGLSQDKLAVQKLRRKVERVKRALSSSHQERMEIKALFDGVDFSETLTRELFEELNDDLFKRTLGTLERLLEDNGIKKAEVDKVVLVGGSTHIPKVQQLVKDFFEGKEPARGFFFNTRERRRINPDEAVAYGAAVQAAILSGREAKYLFCPLHSLCPSYEDEVYERHEAWLAGLDE